MSRVDRRKAGLRGSFLGHLPSLSYLPTARKRFRLRQGRFLMQKPLRLPGRTRAKREEQRQRARA